MSKPKFTPGPWSYCLGAKSNGVENEAFLANIHTETWSIAAVWKFCCFHGQVNNEEESEANARLIAAAPEMYDLLKDMVENYDQPTKEGAEWERKVYEIMQKIDGE